MKKKSEIFLIEEYRANWTYYNKTLDERKNLFDWFLRIVGITSAGFGIAIRYDLLPIESKYYGYFFFLITALGLALFLTYLKETSNSKGYLWSNNLIRDYFREEDAKLKERLTADQYEDKYAWMGKIMHWRSSIFITLNMATAFIGISMLYGLDSCLPWIISIIMVAFQIIMFRIFIKSYQLKNSLK